MGIEIWKDVAGYEGLYQVSNLGNVRSVDKYTSNRFATRFWPSKALKLKNTRFGYVVANLSKEGKLKNVFVHRIVCAAFIGDHPNKQVNHINGIKTDNRLENLEWVTSSENHLHAFKTGLRVGYSIKGSQSSKAKLDETKVREIKLSSNSVRNLAKIYGVHHSVIQGIKTGKRWPHVVV
jgi:hypothetical protein